MQHVCVHFWLGTGCLKSVDNGMIDFGRQQVDRWDLPLKTLALWSLLEAWAESGGFPTLWSALVVPHKRWRLPCLISSFCHTSREGLSIAYVTTPNVNIIFLFFYFLHSCIEMFCLAGWPIPVCVNPIYNTISSQLWNQTVSTCLIICWVCPNDYSSWVIICHGRILLCH